MYLHKQTEALLKKTYRHFFLKLTFFLVIRMENQ